MAIYDIQQLDIDMLKSRYNNVFIKLELCNIYVSDSNGDMVFNKDFKPIADISGEMLSGSCSIDSSSDIRRTLDLSFIVLDDSYQIGANRKIWLNKFIKAYVGISNYYTKNKQNTDVSSANYYNNKYYDKDNNIAYYPLGVYILNNPSYSYSADSKELSVSCTDLVSLLNGDRNGCIPGMMDMEIYGCPEICNAEVKTVDETNKIVTINVIDSTYQDIPKIEGTDDQYYYDRQEGFKILSYSSILKEKYKDYQVKFSINNCTSYLVRLYNVDGDYITFDQIDIDQDYYFNFAGKNVNTYCWALLGTPSTISGVISKTLEQFTPFNTAITDIQGTVLDSTGLKANYVPYNIDFEVGTTAWEVITKMRDLYSGWEVFFDVDGTFVCQAIPTCADDPIVLSEDVFDEAVISETSEYDFTTVKNVTEIWAKTQETDRYDDEAVITFDSDNKRVIIDLSLPLYAVDIYGNKIDPYVYTSELIGFTTPVISDSDRKIAEAWEDGSTVTVFFRVNYDKDNPDDCLPMIPMIDDYQNKTPTSFSEILGEKGYCITCKYKDTSSEDGYAIFSGEFQIHAVCMLVDEEPTDELDEIYKTRYNCTSISYITNKTNKYTSVDTYDIYGNLVETEFEDDCPFTVEKCGELLQVLNGDDFDNIYTTDLARQRAEYEAWKAGRLTDSLSVDVRLMPFLDVNTKIKYTSQRTGKVDTYIIKSVKHSFDSFTTSISMCKFYASYPYVVNNN